MSPSPEDQRISIFMSPNELHEFFEKLATDDDFRADLQSNPQETLAAHHIHMTPDQIPDPVELPSKAALQAAMASWTGTNRPFPFICWDSIPFLLPEV